MPARFELGRLLATPGALSALETSGETPLAFLQRHQCGDWGDVGEHDRNENEFSLSQGFRLLSVYRTKLGARLWVITEADRSSTTLLLPEEY